MGVGCRLRILTCSRFEFNTVNTEPFASHVHGITLHMSLLATSCDDKPQAQGHTLLALRSTGCLLEA